MQFDFSMITVSYNSASTIRQCIASVDNQTDVSIEHVFIDGKSADSTTDIIKSVSKSKSYFVSERDNGIYNAMNKGLNVASGKYVGIINSDDYLINDSVLSRVKQTFEESGADIVYAGISYINDKGTITSDWIPEKHTYGCYKSSWHTPHPGFFVKREIYLRHGVFDENLTIAADFELMMRFMENKHIKSKALPEVVAVIRNDGASSSILGRIQGVRDITYAMKKANTQIFILVFFARRYWPKFLKKFWPHHF